jgi:3-methyl-2-oxobutanoate hydroxymethyltransferase
MSNQSDSTSRPSNVTTRTIADMKQRSEKISMLTAYDFTMAQIIDQAGIDIILVGDSAANVMAGHKTTVPMTLDQMIYHTACVARGVKQALVIGDMPFMSFQVSDEEALRSAGRMMKETGAQGIKMEGGQTVVQTIEKVTGVGIPVMGHLGLTPQSINQFGGFQVQAHEEDEARRLLEDAKALEQAGCFSLVLEKIPADLAKEVTEALSIPTIGIGGGPHCDGQVLVVQDMLGLNKAFSPKFLRRYADLGADMEDAVKRYITDVKSGDFPNENEQYD